MGMPEDFDKSAPALASDDFRRIFSWVASGQEVQLKETRTSDNRFLKCVYHFTLPATFRGGFRASREVYLVFDRDIFSEVRGEVLGIAKGQEIKPSLAGFGDPVTDWFFRTGLQSGQNRSIFSFRRQTDISSVEKWWVSFVARWKQSANWAGSDTLMTFALNEEGEVLRQVPTKDVFAALCNLESEIGKADALPILESAQKAARESLRGVLPKNADTRHLALFTLNLIAWENEKIP